MKKGLSLIGVILILLGLEVHFFRNSWQTFVVYLAAGSLLIIAGYYFDRLTKLQKISLAILYSIPLVLILIIVLFGRTHTTDFNEDVVFVLGAGLRNDEIRPTLQARLDQAVVYFEQNSAAIFIVCGGYGKKQTISEAEAMASYLIAAGIPEQQVLLEDRSTNTYENFEFAIEILNNYFPTGFNGVVITNDFHIFRSKHYARVHGIEVNRFGSSTPILTWHANFMREAIAVATLWLR